MDVHQSRLARGMVAACARHYPPRFARCEALLGDKERLPRLIIEAAKGGIRDVRFRGESGHGLLQRTCPLLTQIGHRGPFQCAGFSRYDTSSEPFGTAMRRREFITLFGG